MEGESVAGYVCRYLGANGHRIQRSHFDLLVALYCGRPDTALKANHKIKELVGDISQTDNVCWLNHGYIKTSYLSIWLPLQLDVVRICPQCIKEMGYHSVLWEFSLAQACPLHETALLEACTACSAEFEWMKIAPDWHCLCGADIKAMQPSSAKSGCIALAMVLAMLQKDIQAEGVKSRNNVISIYKSLEWGYELARIFSPNKSPTVNYLYNRRRSLTTELSKIAWVAKLFVNSLAEMDKSITRAIKRHFKGGNSLLESFCVDDVMAEAIEFIVKNPDEYLAKKIFDSFNRCLKKYCYPLPLEFIILFNPRLTDEKFKDCLKNFSTWWENFSKPMATLDGPEHDAMYSGLESKGYRINVDLLIFQMLKVFLNASCQTPKGNAFYPLVDWWKIPDELRRPDPPEQALYQIGAYLKTIPQTELIIAP